MNCIERRSKCTERIVLVFFRCLLSDFGLFFCVSSGGVSFRLLVPRRAVEERIDMRVCVCVCVVLLLL